MQTALLVMPPAVALAPRASLIVGVLALVAFVMALRTLVDRRHHRAVLLLTLLLLASPPAIAQVFSPRMAILTTCSPDVIDNTCGPGPSWCREWHEWACWLCSIGLC